MEKVVKFAIIPSGWLAEWIIYPSMEQMIEYYTRAYKCKISFQLVKTQTEENQK